MTEQSNNQSDTQRGKQFDLEITTLAYGGDAIGRLPDGRAVFTPFALPGETVRVEITEEKRGFARAHLREVLAPSPRRIQPRCIHFGYCGGCHYQHLAYADQLAAKTDILRDQLSRIGQIANPNVLTAVASPRDYYYRNNIQFHQTPEGKLGFHKFASNQVFAIQECHLPEAPINELWPLLDIEHLEDLERIGLRLGAEEDILLTLESENPMLPDFNLEELPISAVHLSPGGVQVLAGDDHLMMQVLGRAFKVSAGSFFQVNTFMAEAMVTHLLENLEFPAASVMDVYAGAGLFSAFLAARCQRLVAVEASASACDDFAFNLDEFENVELYQGLAEQVLPLLDLTPEIVVVDPPRAGIERHALDAIIKLSPRTLAYISCDPATLGRDARRLTAGGYTLRQATPFDLFPQTFHIESISFWDKTG